jgi:hypothetical protein
LGSSDHFCHKAETTGFTDNTKGPRNKEVTICNTEVVLTELWETAKRSSWAGLYISILIKPFWMVVLTSVLSKTESFVSKTVRMEACFRVTTPEPTVAPNKIATSLAPTENAKTDVMKKPRMSIYA